MTAEVATVIVWPLSFSESVIVDGGFVDVVDGCAVVTVDAGPVVVDVEAGRIVGVGDGAMGDCEGPGCSWLEPRVELGVVMVVRGDTTLFGDCGGPVAVSR
jgi:hypothetical protein